MPKKCCIPNCRVEEDDPIGLNLNFFQIPKDESRRKEWIKIINNHFKTEIKLPKLPHICSMHFDPTSFSLNLMRVRLKREACPSIFIDKKSIVLNKTNNINEQVASEYSSNVSEVKAKTDLLPVDFSLERVHDNEICDSEMDMPECEVIITEMKDDISI